MCRTVKSTEQLRAQEINQTSTCRLWVQDLQKIQLPILQQLKQGFGRRFAGLKRNPLKKISFISNPHPQQHFLFCESVSPVAFHFRFIACECVCWGGTGLCEVQIKAVCCISRTEAGERLRCKQAAACDSNEGRNSLYQQLPFRIKSQVVIQKNNLTVNSRFKAVACVRGMEMLDLWQRADSRGQTGSWDDPDLNLLFPSPASVEMPHLSSHTFNLCVVVMLLLGNSSSDWMHHRAVRVKRLLPDSMAAVTLL